MKATPVHKNMPWITIDFFQYYFNPFFNPLTKRKKVISSFFSNCYETIILQLKNHLVCFESCSPWIYTLGPVSLKKKYYGNNLCTCTTSIISKSNKVFFSAAAQNIFLLSTFHPHRNTPDEIFWWELKVDNKMNTIFFKCIAKMILNFL